MESSIDLFYSTFFKRLHSLEVPVKHSKRKYGKSKFGLERYLRGALDLVTVLFLEGILKDQCICLDRSVFSLSLGFLILLYFSIVWFMGFGIGFRPLFFLGILLAVNGLQLLIVGLLGELFISLQTRQDTPMKIYSGNLEN